MIDLEEVFQEALTNTAALVVSRFRAKATQFMVDPGELFNEEDWVKSMMAADLPAAVAANIVAEAAAVHGFENILDEGFEAVEIQVAFQGRTIEVSASGLKPSYTRVVNNHVNSLGNYSASIQQEVFETVNVGIADGASVDDIAESLTSSKKFSETSARAFAQTETIAAENGAAFAGYPEDAQKEWLYTHDSRVRVSHQSVGSTGPIPMSASFDVGGFPAKYPGDPALPPKERVWCRCAIAPVVSLTASASPIDSGVSTRDNLVIESQDKRFKLMGKTVLTFKKEEDVSTEAVDLSEATRNCGANKGCCDDCGGKEDLAVESSEEFAEDDTETKEKVEFEWEGVLAVLDSPTGDGRQLASDGMSHRDLPVALMLQKKNEGSGHMGAEIAGSIHEIEVVGLDIIGRGFFDSGEVGQEAKRLVTEGTMQGVSVDLDMTVMEFQDTNGKTLETFEDIDKAYNEGADEVFPVISVLTEYRIMGATLTPFPAFQEANIQPLDAEDRDTLVASGATESNVVMRASMPIATDAAGWSVTRQEALVASAGFPHVPPVAWFGIDDDGDVDAFPPATTYENGRVFGVVAEYGSCHIGFGQCVTVPEPWDNFAHVCNKSTLTDDGLIATASIYLDTVHPDLTKNASDTQTWYANTGDAVADVSLWNTERGIVMAGAVRPGITDDQLRTLRGSDISPDWRTINGKLTMVGLLAVNVSGFIVARDQVLVASGGSNEVLVRGRVEDGVVTALVAAGAPQKVSRLEELETLYGELLHKVNTFTGDVAKPTGPTVLTIPKKASHSIKLKTKSAPAFRLNSEIRDDLSEAIKERFGAEDVWTWVMDFDLATGLVYFAVETHDEFKEFQLSFTSNEDGLELSGDEPVEVEREVSYVPA